MITPIKLRPVVERFSPLHPWIVEVLTIHGAVRVPLRCTSCRAIFSAAGEIDDALDAGCPLCQGALRREDAAPRASLPARPPKGRT